ncbi:MAG TPA: peptidoglycan DD-metalloendopeptidase family protein [Egibacteraceae bacterium]|nr:peptidoglycan DD-metalloendopeptidase family protein [Egibacteraceae bacterium]
MLVRVRLLLAIAGMAALVATLWPAGAAATGELDQARAERDALQARVVAVVTELETVSDRLDGARTERGRLEADVAALQVAAEQARAALAGRAIWVYKYGQADAMEMLLDAQEMVAAVDRARLLDSVGSRDRETIERAVAARDALAQRRATLDARVAGLTADEQRLVGLRGELEAAFAQAQAREQELASRRSRQRQVSRGGQRGVYACPMAAPYHFRDTWGAPRSGGRRHKGVDIFAPMAADVYAITSGVIARHSASGLGGVGLYLRGDDGIVYYYAHLQRIAPGYGPGRRVEAGEPIASNGNSGNARGGAPHVHFEAHPGGGGPVNPYPYTVAACR